MDKCIVLGMVMLALSGLSSLNAEPPALQGDDVVFMYAPQDKSLYEAYGATFLAWGGASDRKTVEWLQSIGVHPTGTMWCLTAGAEVLHKDEALREAVVRDIAGKPIAVPWLFDHVYEGTPTWWGCTNHPAFRAHLRKRVVEEMQGGTVGLHIDDHMGSAAPSHYAGGCYCDYCMLEFRTWLQKNGDAELKAVVGVSSFETFDYRSVVRKYASTPEDYKRVQNDIPLHQAFLDCQLQLAAENVRQLGELASGIVKKPITLSANTGLPWPPQLVVTPFLTHLVGEISHHADKGTSELLETVRAYRMAETIGKPFAATASGHDWAWVKEANSVNLVKVWIALSHACGQRLMAPHHQWCFSEEKGTHWYDGPTEAYAPIYRFVRSHRELFRNTQTIGPLAPPDNPPTTFETHEKREKLVRLLEEGDSKPLSVGEKIWAFPRKSSEGKGLIHLVNLDYQSEGDRIAVQKNVNVSIPAGIFSNAHTRFAACSPDIPDSSGEVNIVAGNLTLALPELRIWSVIRLD